MNELKDNNCSTNLVVGQFFSPQILVEEKDFLIVYKPPGMHSAPLANSARADTLLDWCVLRFPEVADLPGRKAGEGGLLHRLDYETQGLLLLARTKPGMEFLLAQQTEGRILKEYSALAANSEVQAPGFPAGKPDSRPPARIQSDFRPYGPGRKAVRPVLNADGEYVTEILEANPLVNGITAFRVRICRGFRHQIRCHLAWLGMPIVNDSLYGGAVQGGGAFGDGLLCLRACSLLFTDPAGRERFFSISPLESAAVPINF